MGGNKWASCVVASWLWVGKEVFTENLEWLEGFDEVIVMFDMDKQGRKACSDVQGLLSLISSRLPNCHSKTRTSAYCLARVMQSLGPFTRKRVSADGIVNAADIREEFFADETEAKSYAYPWCEGLNKLTKGLRKGELVMLTAGTGIGKSTAAREIAYKLKTHDNMKMGLVFLERKSQKDSTGVVVYSRLKALSMQWGLIDRASLKPAYDELFGDGRFCPL